VASYFEFAVADSEYKLLSEDFTIAWEGRRIGSLLNALAEQPAPEVGVLAAGGVAVAYHGRVVDLLGLNWAEMAHASGRRTGVPGHSAFNVDVFWKHAPQLMLPRLTDPANPLDEKQMPVQWELSVLHGLMNEQRFRDNYRPVFMRLVDREIFAYARTDFVDKHRNDSRIVPLSWERFRPLPSAGSVGTDFSRE
jgi:hypothetical protein